jgi:hypothetical protein
VCVCEEDEDEDAEDHDDEEEGETGLFYEHDAVATLQEQRFLPDIV